MPNYHFTTDDCDKLDASPDNLERPNRSPSFRAWCLVFAGTLAGHKALPMCLEQARALQRPLPDGKLGVKKDDPADPPPFPAVSRQHRAIYFDACKSAHGIWFRQQLTNQFGRLFS